MPSMKRMWYIRASIKVIQECFRACSGGGAGGRGATEASCDPTEDFEGGSVSAGGSNNNVHVLDHELVEDDEDGNQVLDGGDEKKTKKIRTTFTGRQIFELETMFEHKKYLSSSERLDLSQRLNVTEQQVGGNSWTGW